MPRIYHTRVAPMGGHRDGKSGSEYILIELMADIGAVGIGEISDIEPDWGAVDWTDLQDRLTDTLLGKRIADRQTLVNAVDQEIPSSSHRELKASIRCAVETSLLDWESVTWIRWSIGGLGNSHVHVSPRDREYHCEFVG